MGIPPGGMGAGLDEAIGLFDEFAGLLDGIAQARFDDRVIVLVGVPVLVAQALAGGLPAVATCAEAVGKLAQLEEMLAKKVNENKDKVEWWKLMLSYYQSRGNERKRSSPGK